MDGWLHREGPAGGGRGVPILFVHGAWHGAWCWRDRFLPWFAGRGHPAWALDLRGHGGRPAGKAFHRLRVADYVDDLGRAVAAVREAEGAAPVLVGHSMGGLVVQHHLARRTAPAAVLLASVPPRGIVPTVTRGFARHTGTFLRLLLTGDTRVLLSTERLVRDLLLSEATPRATVRAALERVDRESWMALADMAFLALPDPTRVLSPVAVLGGEDDGIVARHEIESTARAYRTTPAFFPGGHDLMLDVAWEAVAEHVQETIHRHHAP